MFSVLGAPPRKVVAEALNATAIKVTWKPPLSVRQQGHIQGYHLICSRLKNGEPHGQQVVMDTPGFETQVLLHIFSSVFVYLCCSTQ